MTKRKKKRVAGLFKTLATLLIVGGVVYFAYIKAPVKKSSSVDSIKGYNYIIEKRDSKLMKDTFGTLKDVLMSKNIDFDKYAEYLGKLFIIDLYTLSNKENKYDVGGTEYIYPSNVDNYKLRVQDTLYKYLENKDGRKQNLPTVSSINLDSLEPTTYKYQDKEYEAYELIYSWEYSKDYGYDTNGKIIIMKDDIFLYVVEFTNEVES